MENDFRSAWSVWLHPRRAFRLICSLYAGEDREEIAVAGSGVGEDPEVLRLNEELDAMKERLCESEKILAETIVERDSLMVRNRDLDRGLHDLIPRIEAAEAMKKDFEARLNRLRRLLAEEREKHPVTAGEESISFEAASEMPPDSEEKTKPVDNVLPVRRKARVSGKKVQGRGKSPRQSDDDWLRPLPEV